MARVIFDHSKLKGRARERGMTLKRIQKETGISMRTMSLKWNGKGSFNDVEIYALCALLDIDDPRPYFFTTKVY